MAARRQTGLHPVENNDLKFTGRVFVYHTGTLFSSQKERLINEYKKKNLYLQLRGFDYWHDRNKGAGG
ncbi:hypothetical protein GMPD_10860 [Geomonas paludis]|uniref:Uncharacterized protein n=1 Tax=Geomonas paludis TaxID=2740185 RepID=A0A6V8MTV9_9BACT|nr:hypothetical protein GMPD_10860 [Geomonas paludis]